MKHPSRTLLGIAVLLIPALLLAQSEGQMYADANKMQAEADKQLNAAYESLIKTIHDEGRSNADLEVERLRDSQRAWLKYRDAQVAFVGMHGNIGSSSARFAGMAGYSVDLTKERIKDLKDVPNPF